MATDDGADSEEDIGSQGDLFAETGLWNPDGKLDTVPDWPKNERFPLNRAGRTVAEVVVDDLTRSDEPLIITGFASLDRIVSLLADVADNPDSRLRLVLGNEPFESKKKSFALKGKAFPDEVREYWLERGISLFLSAKLIAAIELIETGRVQARYVESGSRRLHAKMYCGIDAVTMGSSNFTHTGLTSQLECNTRFCRDTDKKRFQEARQIAENYWSMGTDYTQELLALLQQLLRVVTWQEALARACAELLEGEWARRYLQHQLGLGDTRLWPSQQVGIAQALWILENIGSVLVADPTGSGKTRMGAHLVRALVDRIWSSGRARRDISVLVCPPAVETTWRTEATNCGLPLQTRSHGVLSRRDSESFEETAKAVRRAQTLAVDEAHNFLNLKSRRTQEVLANIADHVVLFTATPINRGAADLLSLVDMLGADNMEDTTLKVLESLSRRKNSTEKALSPSEVVALKEEINRFTLRRTKTRLNEMVDLSPDEYLDGSGKRCRYPHHQSLTYETGETDSDKHLAEEIRSLANKLKGLALLEQVIEVPESFRHEGWSDEVYLKGRLSATQHLSVYNVMSRLRSSKAALHEHLLGTDAVIADYQLEDVAKATDTGNIIGKLKERAIGAPPDSNLDCELPTWLSEEDAWRAACDAEVEIYETILHRLASMSLSRERAKAKHLRRLLNERGLVLAFDSHLITLEVIRKELAGQGLEEQVIVATGANASGRRSVIKAFARESKESGIALCSDSMSEGLNLQGASVVMHLDMPSVVRIAEQRVGRVDRMDSPHPQIQAWWPNDSSSFAIRADERFVLRYQTVETLLGANMPLPEGLWNTTKDSASVVTPAEMINETEAAIAQPWDGIQDAFSSVRDLVNGKTALIQSETYEAYRDVSSNVVSRVGLVRSSTPWAFFAVAGYKHGAPKWVLFEGPGSEPVVKLDDVCHALREKLSAEVESLKLDTVASQWLDRFLSELVKAEPTLLPRKKQRALDQMHEVLGRYAKQAQQKGDNELAARWLALRQAAQPQGDQVRPDLETVAERWLDLIRPLWFSKLADRHRRRRPLLLKDLRQDLFKRPLEIEIVESHFANVPIVDALDERIAACIIGVPFKNAD